MTSQSMAGLGEVMERQLKLHSARRVALAAFVVGAGSIATCLSVYAMTVDSILASLAFGVSSLLLVNVSILAIVPRTDRLKESKRLLSGALKDPGRIRTMTKHKVSLADGAGRVRSLNGIERRLWETQVVPFFLRRGMPGAEAPAKEPRKLTASERRYVEEQKKLVQEKEKAVREEEERIAAERERMVREREELAARTAELRMAEELVIERLSKVETVEAELEQLRYEVECKAAAGEGGGGSSDEGHLREREAALRTKEAELDVLKVALSKDREAVEAQKTDLNRLKGEILRAAPDADLAERERLLEARVRELDAANEDLEARSRYVSDVEESLIERLNSLNEREASVEQIEINAGLRAD